MILAKRPRRIPQRELHPEDAIRRIYKHIRLWRRPSWHPHSRRHAHAVGPRLRPHETPDHATHGRPTPNMASGCPRQPRPPLQLRLLFLIVYAPGAHGTRGGRSGARASSTALDHWPLVGLSCVIAAPPDPLAVHRIRRWVCRSAKDTPLPSARLRHLVINLCSTRASPDRPRWPTWPSAPTA